jgi:hypothetical protein
LTTKFTNKPTYFASFRSLTFKICRISFRKEKEIKKKEKEKEKEPDDFRSSIRICQKAQFICVTMYNSLKALLTTFAGIRECNSVGLQAFKQVCNDQRFN